MITSVDLRSEYEQVYSQGSDPSCGPHAITAALDAMYEHATGKQHRFDKQYIWDWSRMHLGAPGQLTGSTFESLSAALRVNGAKLDGSSDAKPHTLIRTTLGFDGVAAIKRLLCLGVPVVLLIQITDGFSALQGNWKSHQWNYPEPSRGEHFVCIVGFDDAAGRFLIENSWGTTWGDGGFCGMPYSYLYKSGLVQGWMHIDRAPIMPKPVQGYVAGIPHLLQVQASEFTNRAKPALIELMSLAMTKGADALVKECIKWGVSDKHLESLAGWNRGAVRAYAIDHPEIDFTGFTWDEL